MTSTPSPISSLTPRPSEGPVPEGEVPAFDAQRVWGRRDLLALLLLTFVAGVAARTWQHAHAGIGWWNDSDDYRALSEVNLWSMAFWAGHRSVAVPLLLKLAGGSGALFVRQQIAIAALCWTTLACAIATGARSRLQGVVLAAVVLAVSVTTPIALWDDIVLSETLAVSFLALSLAAGLWLARRVTWPRCAAFVGSLALWLASRDTHTIVILVVAVGLALWSVVRWRQRVRTRISAATGAPSPTPKLVAVSVALVVLAAANAASAAHGERQHLSLLHVFAVRILPYPDRVAWFSAHGMPMGDRFNAELLHSSGGPIVMETHNDDPAFRPWHDWLGTSGRAAFLEFVVTHPDYALGEPFRQPERSYDDVAGGYATAGFQPVPIVSSIFYPDTPIALMLVVVAFAAGLYLGCRGAPLFMIGVITIVLAGLHALVAWQADGVETPRHLLVADVQLRLGLVLLIVEAATVFRPTLGSRR